MKLMVRAARHLYYRTRLKRMGKSCRLQSNVYIDGHVELGDHCRFRNGCIMRTKGGGRIIFDDYCGLSWNCIVEANSLVRIGSFTGIAEFTVIRDTNHFVIGTDAHWRMTPIVCEPIVIGDCVLIGSGCYIYPGVTIGDGAVVGAGSVVHRDIGPYEVWSGNPARKIAHRTQNVSEKAQRQYEELLGEQGMKTPRYAYTDEHIRSAAAEGRNRAMEVREKLIEEYGLAGSVKEE
jgi:acetyltransferase-like isoleucine patch superfamily enzyme